MFCVRGSMWTEERMKGWILRGIVSTISRIFDQAAGSQYFISITCKQYCNMQNSNRPPNMMKCKTSVYQKV